MLPNQSFDPKFKESNQKTYEELVELQAYQWMRIETFKNIKLMIQIPGNLDLYVGSGINIVMPGTFRNNKHSEVDKKYSGRYVIAGLTHKITWYGNDNRSVASKRFRIIINSIVYREILYGQYRKAYREG